MKHRNAQEMVARGTSIAGSTLLHTQRSLQTYVTRLHRRHTGHAFWIDNPPPHSSLSCLLIITFRVQYFVTLETAAYI